ncbi:hypothetical protein ACFOY2_16410 [Nonomuraea purpurea]|uniref:GNAT family N-acetyltransferase n=1 Tax=Nonomuraea purpurea TaxID=1849276 RepID=A0ABV8G859_9ACTN
MTAPPDANDVMEDVIVVERSMDNPDLFALLYDRYFKEVHRMPWPGIAAGRAAV